MIYSNSSNNKSYFEIKESSLKDRKFINVTLWKLLWTNASILTNINILNIMKQICEEMKMLPIRALRFNKMMKYFLKSVFLALIFLQDRIEKGK